MYSVQLVIDTPHRIAGLEHATALYNSTLPKDENGDPINPLTPEQYVLFVGATAVMSYARQKVRADFEAGDITRAQLDAALAEIENGG